MAPSLFPISRWLGRPQEDSSESKVPMIIDRKPLKRRDCHSPSIAILGDDILLAVLQTLQDSHAASLPNVRLVSSTLNHLAKYVSHSDVSLTFSNDENPLVKQRLDYIEEQGLLPAIRVLKVVGSFHTTTNLPPPPSEAFHRLHELLPAMKGLRDFWWTGPPIGEATLHALAQTPRARLHLRLRHRGPGSGTADLDRLQDCAILHELDCQHVYVRAEDCAPMTNALKKILLGAPNLRSLKLNIALPRGGCVVPSPPTTYCGMGFVNGERPAALESLTVEEYPWGHVPDPVDDSDSSSRNFRLPFSQGYAETRPEDVYWAEVFDWSRLKSLNAPNTYIALTLMPKLTALEEISIAHSTWGLPMSRFYLEVPASLTSITAPSIGAVTLEGILRHGAALKHLQLHQNEKHDGSWSSEAIDTQSLERIRAACPRIEQLYLDLARSGEWPYDTLDVLASFPRLRHLTICFALEHHQDLLTPLVTFSAVETLFAYLRQAGARRLRTLDVHSGSPAATGYGYPSPMAFYPRHNSMSFRCGLAVRDDDAAAGKFTTECPGLSAQINRVLRGEREAVERPAREVSLESRHAPEKIAVARHGPKARGEWKAPC